MIGISYVQTNYGSNYGSSWLGTSKVCCLWSLYIQFTRAVYWEEVEDSDKFRTRKTFSYVSTVPLNMPLTICDSQRKEAQYWSERLRVFGHKREKLELGKRCDVRGKPFKRCWLLEIFCHYFLDFCNATALGAISIGYIPEYIQKKHVLKVKMWKLIKKIEPENLTSLRHGLTDVIRSCTTGHGTRTARKKHNKIKKVQADFS